jgi:predicted nucleotidyltransferase
MAKSLSQKTRSVSRKIGLKSNNMDKIKEIFYEFPLENFTIRGIANKTKIPKSTVNVYLEKLKSEGLVNKNNQFTNSNYFKIKKTHYYIEKMFEIGLMDYLIKELTPETIILFGSFRKGESVKESDLDLFVVSHTEKKLNLAKFEKKLKHKIELHLKTSINQLHDNLFNNVVNGIKLFGSFKVK